MERVQPTSIKSRRALTRHYNSLVDEMDTIPEVRKRMKLKNAQTVRGMSIDNVRLELERFSIEVS